MTSNLCYLNAALVFEQASYSQAYQLDSRINNGI
jgi:hypothetical protein